MGLAVFTFHNIEIYVIAVDEVCVVRLIHVVQSRVVDEGADASHRDVAHADVGLAAVDEASLGIDTLFMDFRLQCFDELRTSKQNVWLAAIALELTNFGSEGLCERLVGRGDGDSVVANESAISPELVTSGSAVDATDDALRGVISDEERETWDKLVVLRAVVPEHFVERARPAFGHIRELMLKDIGENSDVALRVSADVCAVKGIDDRDAVNLELGEGQRDTSMDFLPREGHTLHVVRIVV